MDDRTQIELEAATFRRLVEHLRGRTDVQNIDLMRLAGFCRNCLAKWYRAEADARGEALADAEARERIYGMPYEAWKAAYQREPSRALETGETGDTGAKRENGAKREKGGS